MAGRARKRETNLRRVFRHFGFYLASFIILISRACQNTYHVATFRILFDTLGASVVERIKDSLRHKIWSPCRLTANSSFISGSLSGSWKGTGSRASRQVVCREPQASSPGTILPHPEALPVLFQSVFAGTRHRRHPWWSLPFNELYDCIHLTACTVALHSHVDLLKAIF